MASEGVPAAAPLPRLLNLGCGDDVRDPLEWVNADAFRVRPGVLVLDFAQTPWPLPADHFDHVLWRHGPEHVPFVYRPFGAVKHRWVFYDVLEEIWRVLRPGGTLEVITPASGAKEAFEDPQHVRPFTAESFAHLTRGRPESAYTRASFDLVEAGVLSWAAVPLGPRLGESGLTVNEHLFARAGWCFGTVPKEVRAVLRKAPPQR